MSLLQSISPCFRIIQTPATAVFYGIIHRQNKYYKSAITRKRHAII